MSIEVRRSVDSQSRGQILIAVAMAMVTLIGIAALVIDLGFSWMMRRHEQNAADPAALAAARWIPDYRTTGSAAFGPSGMMLREACAVAKRNGFFPDADPATDTGCVPANDGDRAATLTVNYPPVGAAAGPYQGRHGFVQVVISAEHDAFFGRLFGQSRATVSTSAVAALDDGDSVPYSLIALDPTDECSTAEIGGSGGSPKVTVEGAVHVNSTCGSPDEAAGTGQCEDTGEPKGALFIHGGGQLDAQADVYVSGACKGNPDSESEPAIIGPAALHENNSQIGDPLSLVEPPRIPDYPAGVCDGDTLTPESTGCKFNGGTFVLKPGVYYGGWDVTSPGTRLELKPGIYIIAGGGIKQTNGTIDAVEDPVTGNPAEVLIYSTDNPNYAATCAANWTNSSRCQGGINLNGGELLLEGITTIPRLKGMLLWQDEDGSCPRATGPCDIQLGGQTSMAIAGTIYAPDQAVILDGGSSGTGVASVQIISWQWKIIGNATLSMPWDPNDFLNLQQRGLVR